VFPELSVRQNLELATWLYRKDKAFVSKRLDEVLDLFPRLRERLGQRAGDLSGGEQQQLSLAQAFIPDPKLLLLDELSLGLSPRLVGELVAIIGEIRTRRPDLTIVLVEQSVNVAMTLAERAYFMEKGEIRFHGPTAELLERPDVLRSVFLDGAAAGRDGAGPTPRAARAVPAGAGGVGALATEGLSRSFGGITAVDDVSIAVEPGEVLGIIGPNGAGKTTLFDLLCGFTRADSGRVHISGQDVTTLGPDARARRGLGRSFQDSRLFPSLTVEEAIAVALERWVSVRDPLSAAFHLPHAYDSEVRVRRRVDELVELLGLGSYRSSFIRELSTGSRRVVDLACLLAHRPSVVLLDEPSSGIAQRETEALGPLLTRIRDETGASLVVIEHDMPLIRAVSDRLVAMDLGAVIADGDPAAVLTDQRVVESYLGTDEAAIHRSGTQPAMRG
jgi:branched-chain amino acid transport system ATP-binding protein